MEIVAASFFGVALAILSLLFHVAGAAAIVLLFLLRLNTEDPRKKRQFMALMILLAVFLTVSLLLRPILMLTGILTIFG